MRVAATYLRLFRKPAMRTAARAERRIHERKGDPAPPRAVATRHELRSHLVGAFRCYTVLPASGEPTGTVIYLHGGAYISEIVKEHWAFVDQLVAGAGCRVEVPVYGLAPGHTHRDALAMLGALVEEVAADGVGRPIVLAGDSAGGGLALAFAQSLAGAGGPQPAGLLLLSPWLDATMTNAAIPDVERRDPWLSSEGLRLTGAAWAGDADPGDPRVSPINGPVAGLPPIDLYVGTNDIFLPDCRRLRDLVTTAGGELRLHEAEGGFHNYVLAPVPEGRRDRTRAIADIRRHLAAGAAPARGSTGGG